MFVFVGDPVSRYLKYNRYLVLNFDRKWYILFTFLKTPYAIIGVLVRIRSFVPIKTIGRFSLNTYETLRVVCTVSTIFSPHSTLNSWRFDLPQRRKTPWRWYDIDRRAKNGIDDIRIQCVRLSLAKCHGFSAIERNVFKQSNVRNLGSNEQHWVGVVRAICKSNGWVEFRSNNGLYWKVKILLKY